MNIITTVFGTVFRSMDTQSDKNMIMLKATEELKQAKDENGKPIQYWEHVGDMYINMAHVLYIHLPAEKQIKEKKKKLFHKKPKETNDDDDLIDDYDEV